MRLLFTWALLGAVAFAQTAAKPSSPAPGTSSSRPQPHRPATPRSASAAPDPDEGSVNDDTYTNRFFGLEYTFPENLDVQDQKDFMNGEMDASQRTIVLLAAYGTSPDESGREGVVLVADASQQFGPFADGAEYLRKIIGPMVQKQNFLVTSLATPVDLAGAKWYRLDCNKGETYQSTIATIRRGYALSITLIGPHKDSVQRLSESLKTLKLAPEKSPDKPGPTTPSKPK